MQRYLRSLCTLIGIVVSVHGLTLEDAMDLSQKNHPELNSFKADIAAAEGEKLSANALPNPELGIGPGIKTTFDGASKKTVFHGNIEISQQIEFPGKRSLRVSLAEGDIKLKELALEAFRIQLVIQVKRAFFQTELARQVTELRSEQVLSAQTFLKSARKRVEGGYASDFEMMKAQSDLISAQKGLGESKSEFENSKLRLAGLMGTPLDTAFIVEGAFNLNIFSSHKENSLSQIFAENPIVKIETLRINLAKKNIEAARLQGKPNLTVSPGLEYTPDEQIYGVNFSLPLPVWNRGKGTIYSAVSQHKKATAELEKLKQEITIAVKSAQAKVSLTKEQLDLYPPEFLESLKNIMLRAEKVYGQSSTTLLIYLEARRSYFDNLADYYQTLSQWSENNLELESALGIPYKIENQKKGEP